MLLNLVLDGFLKRLNLVFLLFLMRLIVVLDGFIFDFDYVIEVKNSLAWDLNTV